MRTRPHFRARTLLAAVFALVVAGVTAGFAFARTTADKAPGTSPTAGIVVVDTNLGYQNGAAAGTGMVLTSNGEVLTNNHVVEGATSIRVTVPSSGRHYTATVVGYDLGADVAVLKLAGASGLRTVTLGSSSGLKVGQPVTAIGNAGGTGRLTTATGRITGLSRTITASNDLGQSEQLDGLIEIDANVQAGDSGGPLLDAAGRVIGMDTAASQTFAGFRYQQASAPDAYAIPISKATTIAARIESGQATAGVHVGGTPFLGVGLAPTGYYGSSGVVITQVVPGGPADRAGLSAGDRILAIGGASVSTPRGAVSLLLRHKPGDTVQLTVAGQYGTQQTASVTLAAGPAQ